MVKKPLGKGRQLVRGRAGTRPGLGSPRKGFAPTLRGGGRGRRTENKVWFRNMCLCPDQLAPLSVCHALGQGPPKKLPSTFVPSPGSLSCPCLPAPSSHGSVSEFSVNCQLPWTPCALSACLQILSLRVAWLAHTISKMQSAFPFLKTMRLGQSQHLQPFSS